MDQTESFEFCNILYVNLCYIPNNSCNKKSETSQIIFRNQAFNMNRQTTFFRGGSISPFLHAHYLERTYFQPFLIIILACASYIIFPWNINISIYHVLFITWFVLLRSLYEEPCLINWWTFFWSKDCAILV